MAYTRLKPGVNEKAVNRRHTSGYLLFAAPRQTG
jgi:hypothetical protein